MRTLIFGKYVIFTLVLSTLASCGKDNNERLEEGQQSNLTSTVSTRSNTILNPNYLYLLNGQTQTRGEQISETETIAILMENENHVMVFETESLLLNWAVSNKRLDLIDRIESIRKYRKIGEGLGFPDELTIGQLHQFDKGSQERSPNLWLFTEPNQGGGTWPSRPTWSYGNKRNQASSYAGIGGTTLFDKKWFSGAAFYFIGIGSGNLNNGAINFDDRAESGI
jgi:hypothetical protein